MRALSVVLVAIFLFLTYTLDAQVIASVDSSGEARLEREVEQVTVTGSRAPRPLKLSAVQTEVLSGRDLEAHGYHDLSGALRGETAGLSLQKSGFGNELSMQGLDARHVLLLLDGERLTGDMAGNLDMERFNLHAVERIEIVRGASSTLYGSRATGAVVNMISRRCRQRFALNAGLRWGQPNERNFPHRERGDLLYMYEKQADRPNLSSWASVGWRVGLGREGALGSLTGQTDAVYASRDAFYMRQGRADEKRYTREANPWLPRDTTVLSAALRPPTGIEGAEHLHVQQKLYLDLGHTAAQLYAQAFHLLTYDLIDDLTFTEATDWTFGGKVSNWNCPHLRATLSLHADRYVRHKRLELRDERRKVYNSAILQPRLTLETTSLRRNAVIAGVELTDDRLTSDRFVTGVMATRSLRETEFFVQDEVTLTPEWLLVVGVRTNFSRAFQLMAMPKVAVRALLGPCTTLRLNYSRGYRSPSIKELFFNWDHLGMFVIKGNADLRPERNHYVSAGVEWSKGDLFASGTLYANLFTDKIEGLWKVYDMQYNFEYTNLRNQRLLGAEAMLRWKATPELCLNVTYSYVNVSKTEGLQLNSTSPHSVTGSLEWRRRWEGRRLPLGLTATLSGALTGTKRFDVQDRLTVSGASGSRVAYFRCRLPAYCLGNFNAQVSLGRHVGVGVGVENFANYRPRTLGSGVTLFNVPATPGARFHAQITVNFNKE